MRRAPILVVTTLTLAFAGTASFAGTAVGNPDCYYDAPQIRDVVVEADQIRILGECLVEPYNPIPKVNLGAHEPLPLLRADEGEVIVGAPELAGGEYVLHLHRGYHRDRFAFSEPPRVCRRLHSLRGWSHGKKQQVFPGGP